MKNKKFNLFDLIIIILILGIAAGMIFRNQIKNAVFGTEITTVSVTVKCDPVLKTAYKTMTEGSELYLKSNSKLFGTVKSASAEPVFDEEITFGDGKTMPVENAYCCAATLVISVEGYESDGVFYTKDGMKLLVKGALTLENEYSCYTFTIEKVEIAENS
ncbi:MAG: DUF4330 family protein [Clostridia bacterium]|nr:DUF4330 family protein [Clostridia bacterium]